MLDHVPSSLPWQGQQLPGPGQKPQPLSSESLGPVLPAQAWPCLISLVLWQPGALAAASVRLSNHPLMVLCVCADVKGELNTVLLHRKVCFAQDVVVILLLPVVCWEGFVK